MLSKILTKQQRETFSITREKIRSGKIEKVLDSMTVLVKDLFKKETNMELFVGKKVQIKEMGKTGTVDSTFGKSGKVKVIVNGGVPEELKEKIINTDVEMSLEKELFKAKKSTK